MKPGMKMTLTGASPSVTPQIMPPPPTNRTFAPIEVLVDELARCGVRHAVTSPGSRNAPIILSLADDERIECVSVIDERAAGFVALGIAKASGTPVAVTTTSGTAAANLLPAIVEAREARVPLIVMTADRPPELRDVGACQAIDQLKLYGDAVKWFVEVGTHDPGRETAIHHRALGCRAYAEASGGRPGPVHLNFPLREPLAPAPEELDAADWTGRDGEQPWTEVHVPPDVPDATALHELAVRAAGSPRGAIVCGPVDEDVADATARLAGETGWPLLAEPTSGVRCGEHDRSHVIAHYDVVLRSDEFAAAHVPQLVLRVGDTPTSKPLRQWLGGAGAQVVIDPHGAWHEPTRRAESVIAARPAATCDALAAALEARTAEREPDWIESWRDADALVPPALAEAPESCEPKLLAALAETLPANAVVWISSSMPIRDVEAFFPSVETPMRFLANRGANGIDGVVSSAAGAAFSTGAPAFLVTGELALLHDLGGLLAARRAGAELTIVCLNNGGGGIFDFLPVAESADAALYEEHIATPVGVDLERVAALADLPHSLVSTPDELHAAVTAPGLIEARTDRGDNVRTHREIAGRVADRL